jgi:hypothetical protein
MKVRLKTILLAFLLLAPGSVYARQVGEQSGIKLRGRGQKILLSTRGVRRTLNVREKIYAAKLDEVKLLLVSRKDSFVYLVVSACGSSKLVPDARRCGAAEECSLLWIKLDAAWQTLDIKAAAYESCWQPITSRDGYTIMGRRLRVEYDDFGRERHYRLSYDADRPERAFTIEESPIRDS